MKNYQQVQRVLSSSFVQQYVDVEPPFGFGGVGAMVYHRTYSRPLSDGKGQETFVDTVERVVNGTFNLQQRHLYKKGLLNRWDPVWARNTAQEMFERIFDMRFLPPGRGLWAMGSPLTEERHLYAALNNCAFVSTDVADPVRPFTFLMDASMLGVGVGFDTKGANRFQIPEHLPSQTFEFVIPDSREGWVEACTHLLKHYFHRSPRPIFKFDLVRPAGSPIKGFGGVSAGPEPLKELLESVEAVLLQHKGKKLSITGIVDIMNMIGKCIVSGNVRRSAEIAFGPETDEFLDLKNYKLNPHRSKYGWTSNNSVMAQIGMNYEPIVDRIFDNGEPGLIWLQNMRAFSRMGRKPDFKDRRVTGSNPCVVFCFLKLFICFFFKVILTVLSSSIQGTNT
jgi:ribonucleotide reductase alpha subunit